MTTLFQTYREKMRYFESICSCEVVHDIDKCPTLKAKERAYHITLCMLDGVIDMLEGMRVELPKEACTNLESHIYGSCFECERTKGRNDTLDRVIEKIKKQEKMIDNEKNI